MRLAVKKDPSNKPTVTNSKQMNISCMGVWIGPGATALLILFLWTQKVPQSSLEATIMSEGGRSVEEKVSNKPLLSSPRFAGPNQDEMSEQQLRIRQEILSSRKGTGLSGPFGPWLAVPEIAQPAQALGKACRYGTSLSPFESELVILLTGASTKSDTEFDIHVGEALKAGLSTELIHAIPRHGDKFSIESVRERVLPLLETDRQRAIASFVTEICVDSNVSDQTYYNARAVLGESDTVLVEITSIVGYYTFVAYTLNVFRISS